MKTKEEIMMEHCSDNGLLNMALGKSILSAMEEYAQQAAQADIKVAKPEEYWYKEPKPRRNTTAKP